MFLLNDEVFMKKLFLFIVLVSFISVKVGIACDVHSRNNKQNSNAENVMQDDYDHDNVESNQNEEEGYESTTGLQITGEDFDNKKYVSGVF
ncbi:hypothetical protein AUR40_01015 [Ehrlichia ruminantium]|nr:hypothetical protein AUR40_01015 [Ehrlichia ruminantium]